MSAVAGRARLVFLRCRVPVCHLSAHRYRLGFELIRCRFRILIHLAHLLRNWDRQAFIGGARNVARETVWTCEQPSAAAAAMEHPNSCRYETPQSGRWLPVGSAVAACRMEVLVTSRGGEQRLCDPFFPKHVEFGS